MNLSQAWWRALWSRGSAASGVPSRRVFPSPLHVSTGSSFLHSAIFGVVVVGGGLLAIGVTLPACSSCRFVAHKTLPLDCAVASSFRSELHFFEADTFRSFLTDRCLGVDAAETADRLVRQVDFAVDAVLVARNTRAATQRCIEQRDVGGVEVCDDGVRVYFEDSVTAEDVCPGDWTVAIALSRNDLKVALDGDAQSAVDP